MLKNKKAVVLLSGGLDSTTTLYYALDKGYEVYGLIFDYGQRHKKEIKKAEAIARCVKISHEVVQIAMPWKGSSLLDKELKVPCRLSTNKIPSTYVPARNIIFVSFAASYAEAVGAEAIFIGANAVDYSGYPDCRPDFFAAFQKTLEKGLKIGVEKKAPRILTPLVNMTKAEIIALGTNLGVPYEKTWSCYEGGARPCGICDSCRLRAKGFKEARIKDV